MARTFPARLSTTLDLEGAMDMSSVSDRCRLNRCLRCEEHKRRASKTRRRHLTLLQKLGEETLPLALASSPGIFSGKTREPGDEDSSPTFSTRLLGYSTMPVIELEGTTLW